MNAELNMFDIHKTPITDAEITLLSYKSRSKCRRASTLAFSSIAVFIFLNMSPLFIDYAGVTNQLLNSLWTTLFIFSFGMIIYFSITASQADKSCKLLSPINDELRATIIGWCKKERTIDAYQNSVFDMNRQLVMGEYEAMRQIMDNSFCQDVNNINKSFNEQQ